MSRWVYYNPNPLKREVGDCSVRAICKATGMDWDTAYCLEILEGFEKKEMPSANAIWGEVLVHQGFKRYKLETCCPPDFTVKDFCQMHPEGVYVLGLQGHVVTVVDGLYYDTWDSGERLVLNYWKKEA